MSTTKTRASAGARVSAAEGILANARTARKYAGKALEYAADDSVTEQQLAGVVTELDEVVDRIGRRR